ncbi:MAG: bacillithiol biosynthesis BshC [Gemmatimonadaceae bacterium]
MTLPRIITEELGGSRLAQAAQRGELTDWYAKRPRSADEWREHLHRVASGPTATDWLSRIHPAIAPTGAAAGRLDRVARGGGVVVSTGQQAALFGGPLYTLVKAMGALGFADALEQITGVPTAPVFWAATDDADYEEARSAMVAVSSGLRTLQLPPAPRVGIPMSEMPMTAVEELVDELARACGSVADAEFLDVARAAYTSSATLGNAYVRQLRHLLEPLGISVLDASHPVVRAAAAPVLTRALTEASAIESASRQRYEAIERAGFTAQVEHVPALSLVFAIEAGGEKQRVPLATADRFAESYAAEQLSPNVLLRPIVERSIMPSAAYLAGPGELAYFAQVSAVADVLKLDRPLSLPRWSATLLEPRIQRILDRLGIPRDDLRDRAGVETRLARLHLPDQIAASLRRLRSNLEAEVALLELSDGDKLIPPASVQGLRRVLLHRLDRLERRYVAAVKRRETELMRDVATAAAALYPHGVRQERVLNFVPFLTRYGRELLETMRSEAQRYADRFISSSTSTLSTPVAERV